MITLELNMVPHSLNRMLRMNRHALKDHRDRIKRKVFDAACDADVVNFPFREVHLVRRSPKLLDEDNLYASMKYVLDALVLAGAILDDDPESIQLKVTQETGSKKTIIYLADPVKQREPLQVG